MPNQRSYLCYRQLPLLLLGVMLGVTACRKSEPGAASSPSGPAPKLEVIAPDAAPAAPAAPPPSAPEAAPVVTTAPVEAKPTRDDPTIVFLTNALRDYLNRTGHLPQTLDDLKGAGLIEKVPHPPGGKKFAIDQRNTAVVLVDVP